MIGVLINLLVVFLILAVVFYIIKLAAAQFGAPEFVVSIIGLILLLIFLLYAINAFGIAGGQHGRWWGCP